MYEVQAMSETKLTTVAFGLLVIHLAYHNTGSQSRVNYRCSDIMHVRTPYLEAGSSDRGRGYAKWYLGVNSHHISSESSCK